MDPKTLDLMLRAKNKGCPLVAITTPDPTVVAHEVAKHYAKHEINIQGDPTPTTRVDWDFVRGLYSSWMPTKEQPTPSANSKDPDERGAAWIASMQPKAQDQPKAFASFSGQPPQKAPGVGDATEALVLLQKLPAQSVVFFHQAGRHLGDDPRCFSANQAAANLRDGYKGNKRMIVFLGQPLNLPDEIRGDTLRLDDPLPTAPQLVTLFDRHKNLGDKVKDKKVRDRAAAFSSGMTWFSAETNLYLTAGADGINLDELRSFRHASINERKGLGVYQNNSKLDDIGGLKYVKDFMWRSCTGKRPPNMIINVEEINEAIGQDSNNIGQDQLMQLLDNMEKYKDRGIIFFGVPGCSKSFLAQSLGNSLGVDTLQFDLGAMKQGIVGSSEENIRQALEVSAAASGGRRLWIATCNSLAEIPGNLLRRFTRGTLFFDLPDVDEKKNIWQLQRKAYGITASQGKGKIDDTDWSGADIRNCCEMADDMDIAIKEAAQDISPVAHEDPGYVHDMRMRAHGKIKSASTGKKYRYPQAKTERDEVVMASVNRGGRDID